ncbi:methyltransferase domain-containing protein [Streptomyces sp. NPDC057638]|uniref:class I SAM-dependent methyltransferase n=1 Tax=Streptomyces sp. NPDC057638 TaxID=3346190 RepID=UPI0036764066
MPMNWAHRRLCSSSSWARNMEETYLPWVFEGVDLGTDVLEVGAGYGADLSTLVARADRVTAVEIDAETAAPLERAWGERVRVRVLTEDATALSAPDGVFSAVVSCTMLHHVPTDELQDRLFAEAFRVLRPGGVLAGCDSLPSLGFRVLHIGSAMNTLDPGTLPARLRRAGFTEVSVEPCPLPRIRSIRFLARRPGEPVTAS